MPYTAWPTSPTGVRRVPLPPSTPALHAQPLLHPYEARQLSATWYQAVPPPHTTPTSFGMSSIGAPPSFSLGRVGTHRRDSPRNTTKPVLPAQSPLGRVKPPPPAPPPDTHRPGNAHPHPRIPSPPPARGSPSTSFPPPSLAELSRASPTSGFPVSPPPAAPPPVCRGNAKTHGVGLRTPSPCEREARPASPHPSENEPVPGHTPPQYHPNRTTVRPTPHPRDDEACPREVVDLFKSGALVQLQGALGTEAADHPVVAPLFAFLGALQQGISSFKDAKEAGTAWGQAMKKVLQEPQAASSPPGQLCMGCCMGLFCGGAAESNGLTDSHPPSKYSSATCSPTERRRVVRGTRVNATGGEATEAMGVLTSSAEASAAGLSCQGSSVGFTLGDGSRPPPSTSGVSLSSSPCGVPESVSSVEAPVVLDTNTGVSCCASAAMLSRSRSPPPPPPNTPREPVQHMSHHSSRSKQGESGWAAEEHSATLNVSDQADVASVGCVRRIPSDISFTSHIEHGTCDMTSRLKEQVEELRRSISSTRQEFDRQAEGYRTTRAILKAARDAIAT
eukprot:Sspe_Gene.71431::Locus_42355_Transcript_1_1_Confidence_1.000_Length_1813::g.71431::m.71431